MLTLTKVDLPEALTDSLSAVNRLKADAFTLWLPGKTATSTLVPLAATGDPSTSAFVSEAGSEKLRIDGAITMRQSGKKRNRLVAARWRTTVSCCACDPPFQLTWTVELVPLGPVRVVATAERAA